MDVSLSYGMSGKKWELHSWYLVLVLLQQRAKIRGGTIVDPIVIWVHMLHNLLLVQKRVTQFVSMFASVLFNDINKAAFGRVWRLVP